MVTIIISLYCPFTCCSLRNRYVAAYCTVLTPSRVNWLTCLVWFVQNFAHLGHFLGFNELPLAICTIVYVARLTIYA